MTFFNFSQKLVLDPKMINVLIVGAGAVGSAYGSRMALNVGKVSVSLVCRSNYQIVAKSGIQMRTHLWGDYIFVPSNVYKSVQDAKESGILFDHVIVTTKCLESSRTAEIIKPVVTPNTMIHLIQNGIMIEDDVQQSFPDNSVASGVTYIAASQVSPGVVKLQGSVQRLFTGLFQASDNAHLKLKKFVVLLKLQGMDVHGPMVEIQEMRWHKLLWNGENLLNLGSFNPVSILAGEKNSLELLQYPLTNGLIRDMMAEIQEVAEFVLGRKFAIDLDTVDQYLDRSLLLGEYKPSMLLDWQGNRPLETEAILGNMIRIAKNKSFGMPICSAVYALLKLKSRAQA